MRKYWMVHNASSGAPTEKVHLTSHEAMMEATRLAAKQPDHAFVVLEVVCGFRAHLTIDALPIETL